MLARAIAGILALTLALAQNFSRPEVVAYMSEDGAFRFTQDGSRLVTLYRVNMEQRQTVQVYRLEGSEWVLEDYLWLKPKNYLLAADGTGKRLMVSAESVCNLAEPWPSTHYSPDSLGRLDLLSFPKGQLLLRLEAQSLCGLTYPVFSPDGRLAVPNRNGYVQLWDLQTGQLKHTFWGNSPIDSVAFSQDGSKLAICGKSVAVYEVSSRKPLRRLDKTRCSSIYPVFSPDGSRLLVADGQNPVGIWNLSSGKLERTLPRRDGRGANALAISQDGTRVVTLDAGRGLSVYQTQTGQVLYQTPKGGAALIASPSLEWFATVAPPQLWRLR